MNKYQLEITMSAQELRIKELEHILKIRDMEIHSLKYDLANLREVKRAMDAAHIQRVVLQSEPAEVELTLVDDVEEREYEDVWKYAR